MASQPKAMNGSRFTSVYGPGNRIPHKGNRNIREATAGMSRCRPGLNSLRNSVRNAWMTATFTVR
jgi:hypothetical protein